MGLFETVLDTVTDPVGVIPKILYWYVQSRVEEMDMEFENRVKDSIPNIDVKLEDIDNKIRTIRDNVGDDFKHFVPAPDTGMTEEELEKMMDTDLEEIAERFNEKSESVEKGLKKSQDAFGDWEMKDAPDPSEWFNN